jgi:uncharacterized protein YndB with AHSA1/START domain
VADVPDAIERELILPVPPARVWAALTQADQLSAWFGTRANVDLRPGGAVRFIWDSPASGANSHVNDGVIEVLEPMRRFAFRWQSGTEGTPRTLVDFTLEEVADGTRLRMVESGFAVLARERREGNVRGWQQELGDLEAYLLGVRPERA